MIHIDVFGTGRPIVLLHGTPTPPAHLEPLARALAGAGRVFLVHMPGYGESPSLPRPNTIADMHEAIETSLFMRDVTQASLIGFSGGAYHALALALRGRVTAETVLCLGGFAGFDPDVFEAFRATAAALRSGARLDPPAASRFLSVDFAASHPEVRAAVDRWPDATTAENLAHEIDLLITDDLRPRLAELEMPVLARVGELDAAAPVACSREIASGVRRGRLQVVPRAGHALLYEDELATLASVKEALGIGT